MYGHYQADKYFPALLKSSGIDRKCVLNRECSQQAISIRFTEPTIKQAATRLMRHALCERIYSQTDYHKTEFFVHITVKNSQVQRNVTLANHRRLTEITIRTDTVLSTYRD